MLTPGTPKLNHRLVTISRVSRISRILLTLNHRLVTISRVSRISRILLTLNHRLVTISREIQLTPMLHSLRTISRETRGETQNLRSSPKTTNNQTRRPTSSHRTHRQRIIQRQVPMIKHQEQTTRPQAAETLVTHPPHRHSSHLAQTQSQAEAKTPPHHPRKTLTRVPAGRTPQRLQRNNQLAQVVRTRHQEQTTKDQEERTLPLPLRRTLTQEVEARTRRRRLSSHPAQAHSQVGAKTPPHHPLKTPMQAVAEKTLPHRAPVNSRGIAHRMPVSLLEVAREEERARPSPQARKGQTRKKRKSSLYSLDKLT